MRNIPSTHYFQYIILFHCLECIMITILLHNHKLSFMAYIKCLLDEKNVIDFVHF